MSEFETTINDDSIECPYCGHKHHYDDEDFNEEQTVTECAGCGKKFYSYQRVMIDHRSEPDCEINNELHVYKVINLSNGVNHAFCKVCGKCEPIMREKE